MKTSASSIIIALLMWYIGLGIYNAAYLAVTKRLKEVDWLKFATTTGIILALYALVNFLSIAIFSSGGLAVFGLTNIILLFGVGLVTALFILKEKVNNAIVYATLFTLFFNLLWYRVIGAL